MTLVQLRHLISVAETGSFSRSAEALFITQPALSRSIRALEEELGQSLLDRIGWRSELTPFGREVVDRARRLVADAVNLKESAERLLAGQAGGVRLGLGSGPGVILTVPLLQHMATHHPAARVEVAHASTTMLEQALRDRRLDALVVDIRSVAPSPDLQVEPLAELRGTFMCRPGHPLLALKGPVRFKDLRRYPLATIPLSDEIGRLLVERYGPQAHLDDCVTVLSEDIAALAQVARSTDAVLLSIRAAAPDLMEVPLRPAFDGTARFGLVTLAGRSEPPLLAVVRQLIAERLHD